MKFKEVSLEVSKLLLDTEKDRAWIDSPRVLVAWHIFFCSVFLTLIVDFVSGWLAHGLIDIVNLTLTRRILRLVLSTWTTATLAFLAVQFYRFLLLRGRDLRFSSIFFFFITGILLFGVVYGHLYCVKPSLFSYSDPIFVPSDRIHLGWDVIACVADFEVYSLVTMFTQGYGRIKSNSMIVGLVNGLEVIYGIFMVAVLISTFVQKVLEQRGPHSGASNGNPKK